MSHIPYSGYATRSPAGLMLDAKAMRRWRRHRMIDLAAGSILMDMRRKFRELSASIGWGSR